MFNQGPKHIEGAAQPAAGYGSSGRRRIGAVRRAALIATIVAGIGGAGLVSSAGGALAAGPSTAPVAATASVTGQMQDAANWAIAEKNSPDPTWSDHFGHPWSGWCEQFVEQAEGFAFQFPSAIAHYQWQADNGRIHGDADPPVGALVFYNNNQYGHVAVSIGGGQVIGTLGYDGDRLAVAQYPVGYILSYLGWAAPIGS